MVSLPWDLVAKSGVYVVCPVCGRVTAIDTGYCRHCRSPLGSFSVFSEPPEELFSEGLFLGRFDSGRRFCLDLSVLQKHVAVLGMTGYGKTCFVKRLLYELYERGVRFLVFDWDGEYRVLAKKTGALYFKPGSVLYGLRLNVLDPGLDSAESHVDWLVSVFRELYLESYEYAGLSPQMEYVLRKCLLKCVRERGCLSDLVEEVRGFDEKLPNISATKLALVTRLSRFVESGVLREVFCSRRTDLPLSDIDEENIVVDLSAISSISVDDARFLVNIVLKHVFYKALRRSTLSRPVHVTVVEEAEEVLPRKYSKRSFLDTWTSVKFALRLRKRGECLVLVSHSPDTVEEEALRNCSNVFVFRVQGARNIRVVCGLLGLDESFGHFLSSLSVGEAVVRVADFSECFKITVERVVEEELPCFELTEDEETFLRCVEEYPFMSVRERMRFLGWSGRRYYLVEKSLIEKGLVKCVLFKLGERGRPMKLYVLPWRSGEGLVHKAAIGYLKTFLESLGFKCRTGGRGEPDLIVEDRVAVEVEASGSVSLSEVVRYGEKYERVFVVAATEEAYSACLAKLGDCVFSISGLGELVKEIKRALRAK